MCARIGTNQIGEVAETILRRDGSDIYAFGQYRIVVSIERASQRMNYLDEIRKQALDNDQLTVTNE